MKSCGLMLTLFAALASAQAQSGTNPPAGQGAAVSAPQGNSAPRAANRGGWGRWFVDTDGDGVCDNFPGPGRRFAHRSAAGWGPAFVDRNGYGICDNFPGPGRRGQGRGLRPGAGRGRGGARR